MRQDQSISSHCYSCSKSNWVKLLSPCKRIAGIGSFNTVLSISYRCAAVLGGNSNELGSLGQCLLLSTIYYSPIGGVGGGDLGLLVVAQCALIQSITGHGPELQKSIILTAGLLSSQLMSRTENSRHRTFFRQRDDLSSQSMSRTKPHWFNSGMISAPNQCPELNHMISTAG